MPQSSMLKWYSIKNWALLTDTFIKSLFYAALQSKQMTTAEKYVKLLENWWPSVCVMVHRVVRKPTLMEESCAAVKAVG